MPQPRKDAGSQIWRVRSCLARLSSPYFQKPPSAAWIDREFWMMALQDLGPALLFCPGDRPERFEKAAAGADHAILDLEDGTAPANRDQARANVVAFLGRLSAAPAHADVIAPPVIVRINLAGSERGKADAAALHAVRAPILMLPKVESARDIDAIATMGDAVLIATIESARGAEAIGEILAHPRIAAATWGPYDLAADMGLRKVRDAENRLLPPLEMVRDRLLLAAVAARKPAIDTVTAEVANEAVIAREAQLAADLGFAAKMCIHPSQVSFVRAAYAPSESDIERAKRLLAAGAAAGNGALLYEGEMVDEPMLQRARRILQTAARLRG